MSIGEKLKKIADRMRSVYGSGYLHGHGTGYEEGYDKGVSDGGISAREKCILTHYTESTLGSGTPRIQAQIPFQPDMVAVYSTNPFSSEAAYTFKSLLVNLSSCGKYAGFIQYCSSEAIQSTGSINTSSMKMLFSYENGEWSFEMPAERLPGVVWKEKVRYWIIAAKFEDEDPVRIVEEQLRLLPDVPPEGSGTLTYNEEAIYRHFTPQQWQDLISQKPNWNIVLQ